MDASLLRDAEVMNDAKEAWGTTYTPGRDPCVHWDLAWGIAKRFSGLLNHSLSLSSKMLGVKQRMTPRLNSQENFGA